MLKVAEIGQRVSVGRVVNGQYAGADAAKVVSFDGDGKTYGTITVRVRQGWTETVPACTVNPWPVATRFPRFSKASAK